MIYTIPLVLFVVSTNNVYCWMLSSPQHSSKSSLIGSTSTNTVATAARLSLSSDYGQDSVSPQKEHNCATRREFPLQLLSKSGTVVAAFSTIMLTSTMNPETAAAAASSGATSSNNIITPEEIQRLQIGYKQITYLLDHFEEETTVCRENGGECKRDANSIRKVLGLRSTTDPLFQIEKVFAKFKNLNLDGDVDIEALYDAAEDWNSSISMSNSMAFISQFGEYNPGGGKDEVLKYLLESQKQVLFAKDALQTIMINLKIPLSKE